MSRLTDLLARARELDPNLASELEKSIRDATAQRTFGLVFERHMPDNVELPSRPVRRGDTVRILPPRGTVGAGDPQLWDVTKINRGADGKRTATIARGVEGDSAPTVRQGVDVDDLVVVARYGDTIYPGLEQTGEVIGSADPSAPFHSVINAENLHALNLLTYTHRHQIDCIYIDPPYNTGAKDWKYNNNYVDSEDQYKHSKWLSMMEKRLGLAKELLNPEKSALIVTIDEKEYLRIGMLLEQTFPDASVQMVSTKINATGVIRSNEFTRVNEYIFFVLFGAAGIRPDAIAAEEASIKKIPWNILRRREGSSVRGGPQPGPDQFYAIFVDKLTHRINGVSRPLALNETRDVIQAPEGSYAVFPLKPDGTEMTWGLTGPTLLKRAKDGFAFAKPKGNTFTVYYLTSGKLKAISEGKAVIEGYEQNGQALVTSTEKATGSRPTNQWDKESHNAQSHGTKLLSLLLPGRKFPFPKSVYAVEDSIRFVIGDNLDATILDFFSGSGTTAHAVMRLNKQDGGKRKSISVTNNEVSVEEQVKLTKRGFRLGDPEWERFGICDYVTKPRIKAAITGNTPDGNPIKGDYKFTDEFPMSDGFEANARFFTLTYEPPTRVRHGRAFDRIAPLLWLRAGQFGRVLERIPERGWDVVESHGVIQKLSDVERFADAVEEMGTVRAVYIVADDDLAFQSAVSSLSNLDVEFVQLYSSYLTNFAFTSSRGGI